MTPCLTPPQPGMPPPRPHWPPMLRTWAAAAAAAHFFKGSRAWSVAGHERINRIAQGLLTGKRRDQIRTLEHGDLIEMSVWEQNMTRDFPETSVLHWHHQSPAWTCAPTPGLGEAGGHMRCDGAAAQGSLFCALAYFFDHFAHDKLLKAFPEPKEPIDTPKELPALKKIPKRLLYPASHLRWIGGLIGDLHQPLHLLRQHDYGREAKLVHEGKTYTLLEFWEEYLPTQLGDLPSWASLKVTSAAHYDAWRHKLPTELFRDWAQEIAERLCTEVYAKMEENHADGSRGLAPEFQLPAELYTSWVRLAQELTELAGVRLAFVLEDILEHRRHKHAHQLGRGLFHKEHGAWRRNFAINAGIAAILVPCLLVFFRAHANGNAMVYLRKKPTAMV